MVKDANGNTIELQTGNVLAITLENSAANAQQSYILSMENECYWESSDPDVIDLVKISGESAQAVSNTANQLAGTSVRANVGVTGAATITATDTSDSSKVATLNAVVGEDGSVTVSVEVGGSETIDLENYTGAAGAQTTGDQYIATADVAITEGKAETTVSTSKATSVAAGKSYILRVHDTNYALTSNTGRTDWKTKTLAFEQYTAAEDDNVWTLEASGNGYKLKSKAGYLNLGSSTNTGYVSSTGEVFTLSYSSNGWTVKNEDNIYINALGGVDYYQSAGGYTNGSTTFDLYEVTEATESSTTLTITGTGEGTTSVTVGGTKYNIVVTAPSKTGSYSLAKGNTLTLPDGATNVEINGSVVTWDSTNKKLVAGDENGTATVTFTTVNAGNKVTGRYTYTITVTDIDLSKVADLEIEYWITNAQTKDSDENSSYTIKASDDGVYSEDGVDVSKILPGKTYSTGTDGRKLDYWRCRILDVTKTTTNGNKTECQTQQAGDDDTFNGEGFTHIRYFNNEWAVLVGTTWKAVDRTSKTVTYTLGNTTHTVTREKHQLVAYYMEELPIADELLVNAADWGKKTDGADSSEYLPTNSYCSITIRVVYEDGTSNPSGVTADYLKSSTIGYGYWSSGRGVGTVRLTGLKDYQIWKIEAETGSITAEFGNGDWGSMTATAFSWDNNAMTVFENAENPVDSYLIHNDANSPSSESYYQNLMWDENQEAILLTVYVKAKQTESSLQVVYKDEKFNDILYSYYISVLDKADQEKKTFANSMLDSNGNTVEWKKDGNRNDVTGYGIENIFGKVQYFETDLTKVPEAQGKYNSALYTYTGSEISKDGTILYLYYNLDEEQLSAKYVIDFGLPVTVNVKELLGSNNTSNIVSIVTSAQYGTLTYNNDKETVTYQPGQIMPTMDATSVTITYKTSEDKTTTVIYNIGFYPASTIYYEEGFINWGDGWTGGAKGDKNQKAEVLGKHENIYGYDDSYKSNTGASNGTQATTSTLGAQGTFTFTGTGFDLYANCDEGTGWVAVEVIKADGTTEKAYLVNTIVKGGTSDATSGQTGSFYSIPVVALHGLTHGTYTVRVTKVLDKTPINIDGVRIYNTLSDSSIYAGDQEQNPTFEEIRDHVLNAIGVNNSEQYGSLEDIVDQVYNSKVDGNALIISKGDANDIYKNGTAQDLLDNGPKNELYLHKDESLVFKVTTTGQLQLGLKAPKATTNVQITVTTGEGESETTKTTISSSVDMFYQLANANGTETTYTVTVENIGKEILSVTQLKICGAGEVQETALQALTENDIRIALLAMGYSMDDGSTTEPVEPTEPEEPEIIYADAIVNIDLVDHTGNSLASVQLTDNGISGEKAVFSAQEILEAVAAQIPEKYALVDASAVVDLEITYGETTGCSVQIGKVTTVTVNYVNIFGRKIGTATLTKVQTADGRCKFTAAEIKAGASERKVLWLTDLYVSYGSDYSITVVTF